MSFWRQKKEELNDSSEKLDENCEEVKSTEDVHQSSEEEQINKIIQQLHDEKHKNAELRQAIEQLQVKISSMDSKKKDMGEAADATPKDEPPSEGQCNGQNEKSNEGQNETPSESDILKAVLRPVLILPPANCLRTTKTMAARTTDCMAVCLKVPAISWAT